MKTRTATFPSCCSRPVRTPSSLFSGFSCVLLVIGMVLSAGAAMASTTINESFTPATIDPGSVSTYRVTVANNSLTALTSAAVTVVLPTQIKIATPAIITNTCGFTVNTATPGTSTVYLTGGAIPAGNGAGTDGQCYFEVDVTATTTGNWTATIPANTTPTATTSGYTARENGVSVWNTTLAMVTLSVNTLSPPTGSTTFSPSPAIAGDPIILTVVLSNPNPSTTMPLTTFINTLPTGMVVAPTASPTISCTGVGFVNGVVTAMSGAGTITLTGGTIGNGGACNLTAKVVAASAVMSKSFTSTLPSGAIGNTRGLTSNGFSRSLTVNTPIGVTSGFGTPNIPAGQASLMTIAITNTSTANLLDITSFSESLSGTTVKLLNSASTPVQANPVVTCTGTGAVNGTLTAPANLLDQTITLTGAKAGPGGNCTITAWVTSFTEGAHPTTIAANAVGNPNGYASPGASATLTASGQLTVTKSATVTSVAPGQWTKFTVTINNWSGGAVTNVNFRDLLPANGANQMLLFNAGSGYYTAPSPGCTGGVWTGANATGTSTGLPPTETDAGLLWTGGTIVAGVGSSPGICTVSLWAKLPATAVTGLSFTNNIPIGSITGTGPVGGISNTNLGSVNVATIDTVAVSKVFSPTTIVAENYTTLTLTIRNRSLVALTGITLSDNLPAGMTLAANPAVTNTCGGSVLAPSGGTGIQLVNGGVAARPISSQESTCAISVKITGAVGSYTNTIATTDFANIQGITIPAPVSANLTITSDLTGAMSFTPTTVASGGIARVTITINNNAAQMMTDVAVDNNTFSAGLSVANPANAATNCAGSPTMVVNPGIARAQLLGAVVNPLSSCTFSFDAVTSGTATSWSTTIPIGKMINSEGESNTAPITATLTKTSSQININKSFTPVLVNGGAPSVLQIDIANPSTTIAVSGIGFTDTFPPGMQVYSVPNSSSTCPGGNVTAIPGDGKITLSGATLAAKASCRVYVTVTTLKFLNLTNTIPAGSVVSTQGWTNATSASATLSTLQGLSIMKDFTPGYVALGEVAKLNMRLVNTFDANSPVPVNLTNVSFTDTFPIGIMVSGNPMVTTTCSGTGPGGLAVVTTANIGGSHGQVTVSQADVPAGTNCAISVDVAANTLGAYTNTIPLNAVTSTQGVHNVGAASATLFSVAMPTVATSFANATRNIGTSNRLTVTITNGGTVPITEVALVDTLPEGLNIAATPNTGGTCTSANGIVTAIPGGSAVALTGATIAAGGNCTFWADVVGYTPGTYINNIPAGSIVTNEEGLTNTGATQATMIVSSEPGLSMAFSPVAIGTNGVSVLTLTLINPNTSAITLSSALVDALPGNVVIANPVGLVKSCTGTVTATAGANSLTYASGATIPPGSCTISVNVTSPVDGIYTNTIAAGQLSTSTGVNSRQVTATLAVGAGALAPPTMAVSFSPTTIPSGSASLLTITLGNTNTTPLTLTAPFTDSLPTNLLVHAIPNLRGSCVQAYPGAVTATAGTGTITYASGASIPSGGCTIMVDVTSVIAGGYTNSLTTSVLTTNGGTPLLGATGGLVVKAATPPTVIKAFSPGTINPGDVSVLTISLGNANSSAITLSADFVDTLPGSVVVAATPAVSGSCPGLVTAVPGVGAVTYASGSVIPVGGCTISVRVTSSASDSSYTNIIPSNALATSAGVNGGAATANLFVNPAQPPSISASFSPTQVGAWGVATLTLSFGNGNAAGTQLTVDMISTLPANLLIANPPNIRVGGNCTLAKVGATAGGSTLTYQNGGVIPAGGCSITVDVTSAITAQYYVTIPEGALQTGYGVNAVATTALLNVGTNPTVAKDFAPAAIAAGQVSMLTLTLGNTNAFALTLTADLVDTFPAGMVLATPATVGGSCSPADIIVTSGGVTYRNEASLPAGGCTITVPVTAASAGYYTNTIAAGGLKTDVGANIAPGVGTLSVPLADLVVTKAISVPTPCSKNSCVVTYTINVKNLGPDPGAGFSLTDVIPAQLAFIGVTSGTATYDTITKTVTWTATTPLAVNDTQSLTYTATVVEIAGINNCATLQSSVPADPIATNNTGCVSLWATRAALTDFRVIPGVQGAAVEWDTAGETGTVGFNLMRRDGADGPFIPVTAVLLPALMEGSSGGRYHLDDESSPVNATLSYLLVEQEENGGRISFGPFTFSPGVAGAPATSVMPLDFRPNYLPRLPEPLTGASNAEALSFRTELHPESPAWTARREAAAVEASVQGSTRADLTSNLGGAPLSMAVATTAATGPSAVKIAVKGDGLYFLDSASFAPLLGVTPEQAKAQIVSRTIALTNGGKGVAWLPTPDRSGIWFYGEGLRNQYTDVNIYWLTTGKGEVMAPAPLVISPKLPAPPDQTFLGKHHAEEDQVAALGSPDPRRAFWCWQHLRSGIAGSDRRTFPLALDAPVSGANGTLKMRLLGTTPTANHIRIALNGVQLGEGLWSGAGVHELALPVASSLLQTQNSIEVTSIAVSGEATGVVYVDSLDVSYPRRYRAVNDQLACQGEGNKTTTVRGFTGKDIVVLDMTDPKRPSLRPSRVTAEAGGGYQVTFSPASPVTPYLAALTSRGRTPESMISSAVQPRLLAATMRADWVAITTPALYDAAQRLAARRQLQGLETEVVLLDEVMDAFNQGVFDPAAIKAFLAYATQKWDLAPRFAVLAGDGSYDYRNLLGKGGNLLPPLLGPTPFGAAASDNGYGDSNDDGIPEVVVGRLPVLSAAELDAVTDKIAVYEDGIRSSLDNGLLLVADQSDGGSNFQEGCDDIAAIAPSAMPVAKVYRNAISAPAARRSILNNLQSGVGFFDFSGHSNLYQISIDALLKTADIARLYNKERLPIVTATTCSVNGFHDPGSDSIGEVLVVEPTGGAVAVLSSSLMSMDFQSRTLSQEFHRALWNVEIPTIGEALKKALAVFIAGGGEPYLASSYLLLGDPATLTRR